MVIPVHDVNPLRRTPWVTYALVAFNVIVLLLTPVAIGTVASRPGAAALCKQAAFYDRYAAIPRELTTDHQLRLVPSGQLAATANGPVCVLQRPPYQKSPALSVLWSMFLHGGWLHLLGNMLFLVIFGNNIEDRMRKLPFLIFYLICGYVTAYGFAASYPASTEPLIGASGAISGARDLGRPGRLPANPMIGDVTLPARGVLAIGQAKWQILDPAEYERSREDSPPPCRSSSGGGVVGVRAA